MGLHKADFIMSFVAKMSDVAHKPLVYSTLNYIYEIFDKQFYKLNLRTTEHSK